MNSMISKRLDSFAPLGLDALNQKAAMLERLDNKYVIPASALVPALAALRQHFDILEIGGQRSFTYATRYYDDAGLHGYYDHHQGRRKRCKVRIRDYVDAGFSYLEVKLKDRRSITVKKRRRLPADQISLDASGVAFVRDCYDELYGESFDHGLAPVISMKYQRTTLVAREGGERMTIDAGLKFQAQGAEAQVREGLFIIETKSARGNGLADKILRNVHMHPTARCSKYCVGMAATGQVARSNRFLPALRRLGLVAMDRMPLSLPPIGQLSREDHERSTQPPQPLSHAPQHHRHP